MRIIHGSPRSLHVCAPEGKNDTLKIVKVTSQSANNSALRAARQAACAPVWRAKFSKLQV
jgi:hypothetical protein